VIRAGLRRLALVAATAVGAVTALSALAGLAFGVPLVRAVSLGCYCVGALFLVVGFLVGSRGPVRVRSRPGEEGVLGLGGRRRLGWATREEQEDALAASALAVLLGVLLVVLGVLVDDRRELV
jgi:hypothetical protein